MCVESYESLRRRAYDKIAELERLNEARLFEDISLKSPRPTEQPKTREWSFSGARPPSPPISNHGFFKEPKLELVVQPAAKQEGRDTSPYWYRVVPQIDVVPCPAYNESIIVELNKEIDRERLGYANARQEGRDSSPHWYRYPGGDYN